jgi:hypothetical protein
MLYCNQLLIPKSSIKYIDCDNLLDKGLIIIFTESLTEIVRGPEAIRIVMENCPSYFEGKRFSFVKYSWATHNLLGHPLMQIASFLKMKKLAFWIHDKTIPKTR